MAENIPQVMNEELHLFEQRRRRVYIVTLLLVMAVVLVGWLVRVPDDYYRVWSTPINTVVLTVLVVLLWHGRIPLVRIERAMFLLLAAMPLARQVWLFHFAEPIDEQWLRLLGNNYWATSGVIVIVCTVSRGRRGLLAGAAIVGASAALALSGIVGGVLRDSLTADTLAYVAGALVFLTLFLLLMSGTTIMRDQWQRALARTELYSTLAMTDELTGLANRRAADEAVSAGCVAAARHERPFAVILGDLDRFKALNDNAGHAAGDAVLASVARTLRATVRESDTVARWGGEEFLIIMPETDLDGACQLAERCRDAIEQADRGGHEVTITFGVAQYEHGETPESLVERADEHLYAGKARSGNRVEARA